MNKNDSKHLRGFIFKVFLFFNLKQFLIVGEKEDFDFYIKKGIIFKQNKNKRIK